MNITRGLIPCAKKILIYGVEGIGKSTFASKFPGALFIDTEGSTKHLDVARFDPPSSWPMLLNQVQYVIGNPSICRTLVIDTADWAEHLEINDLIASSGANIKSIEDFNYGKGYTMSAERFGKLLNLLTDVVNKGINVVITGHAQLRKVELPEEMGAYDHWEMKTSKKVAPMIREWADMVLFANYKVNVVNVDNQGAAKGKNKAQGGRRVMCTTHTPFWDAKNRYGLPEELPLDYEAIRHVIEEGVNAAPAPEPVKKPRKTSKTAPARDPEEVPAKSPEKPAETAPTTQAVSGEPGAVKVGEEIDKRVPKNLRDLMINDQIGEWDIMNICEGKGYVPSGTPIWEYNTINPGLIEGGIIGNWGSVVTQIRQMRKDTEIPFN